MKKILVIEDMDVRVNWLKQAMIGHDVEIFATPYVPTFIVESEKPHDLLIFDHDLTDAHYAGYTTQELSGLDAAEQYTPLRVGMFTVAPPAIVWSLNHAGARRIANTLRDKDINVRICPFISGNLQTLKALIEELLCFTKK